MNIQNSVFYVGGSKGGVGKSLFSFALVDYLLNRNVNILLWIPIPTTRTCSRRIKTLPCRTCSAV